MSKTGRNDPCPCGSGKKFKKCCNDISEVIPLPQPFTSGTGSGYAKLTSKYDTIALLKILAVMQLQPENHGKNVRMEELVLSAINTFNTGNGPIDVDTLRRDLDVYCGRTPLEDPPEDFFTENIIFFNGNNTVYPGTFVEGKEIVQMQLDTIHSMGELPTKALHEISLGLLFLLHIHHRIAIALGHTHRMEAIEYGDELFLPNEELLIKELQLIEFSSEEMQDICKGIAVPPDVVEQFVFALPKREIKLNNLEESPMFCKPFVFLEGKYILVMPTGQLSCINDFILSKLREYNVFDMFRKHHANMVIDRVNTRFRSMSWKMLEYQFPAKTESRVFVYREALYQIDSDKISYVMMMVPSATMGAGAERAPKDIQRIAEQRIKSVVTHLRLAIPDFQVFFVLVTAKFDIFQSCSYDRSAFDVADRNLGLSFKELNVLRTTWELDRLSLWKYAGHLAQTRNDIFFMPLNTHLSVFKWYKDQHDWFYHSDKHTSNVMFFEFDIEGAVNRSAKIKEDALGIAYPISEHLMYIPCHKSEPHLPVYLDDNFVHGHYRNCLLRYSCPIWVQSNNQRDFTAVVYMNAVLYWLNFCFPWLENWIGRFGEKPIVVTLLMDDSIYSPENWDLRVQNKQFIFNRRILPELRMVELGIQADLITHLISSGNAGEKFLISELLDLLGELLQQLGLGSKLEAANLQEILNEAMLRGNQKMILITDASPNPKLADIDVDAPRFIQDSAISYIMHHQVSWLGYSKPVLKKLASTKDKIKLLNDLVKVHFNKIIEMIRRFPTQNLLVHLMERHESVIQAREKGKMAYPTLEACYGSYYDVFKEFSERESAMVTTSLALRSLIEFVVCENSRGTQVPNDDDTDLMLALISELINYGSMSDMIHYEIFDPDIGLLPSGRIGIEQTFSDMTLSAFRREIHLEEVDEYRSSFDRYFIQKNKEEKAKPGDNPYYDKVDDVFMEEWGITIWDLQGAIKFLCLEMFHRLGRSVAIIREVDLLKIFQGNVQDDGVQARSILNLLTFRTRDGVLNINPKELHEAFPWRYNRRESYMLRPLIRMEVGEDITYIVSARHVLMATENMLARFMDGTLKVGKDQFKLINLLAERNHLKGKSFRDGVAKWLSDYTTLQVFDFEVKIKPHGFFTAPDDKGDVDILCVDHIGKKIIAIECKNTSQAKIAYDIHTEISSYIGVNGKPGMIQKHVQRDLWLKENLEQVLEKLALHSSYLIESIVLTKHVLPTKFIKDTEIPVYSYSELKRGEVFTLKTSNTI
ncbi:YecA family protein [Sphingobacterium siyangense]